jgi:hypothetical protein
MKWNGLPVCMPVAYLNKKVFHHKLGKSWKFSYLQPNQQPVVRTDWYEVADNKTIDSDSMQYAAAIGQIFFPDDLNQNIYKDPNYKDAC